MTGPLTASWTTGDRGKFCLLLDKHPEIAEWVDFGIVGTETWHETVQWAHPEYGCGRGAVPKMDVARQSVTFRGLFLDLAGMDLYTDRIPNLLALSGATVIHQDRGDEFADFLIPHYAKPGVHMLRAANDLVDVGDVVQAARADPVNTSRISAAASALAEERLSDHACLCAIHANLEAQRRMQLKGRRRSGSSSRAEAADAAAVSAPAADKAVTYHQVTARGTELVRERWHRDLGTTVVVRTRGAPVWWALCCSVLCLALGWWSGTQKMPRK
jgi:hypothetical protein